MIGRRADQGVRRRANRLTAERNDRVARMAPRLQPRPAVRRPVEALDLSGLFGGPTHRNRADWRAYLRSVESALRSGKPAR